MRRRSKKTKTTLEDRAQRVIAADAQLIKCIICDEIVNELDEKATVNLKNPAEVEEISKKIGISLSSKQDLFKDREYIEKKIEEYSKPVQRKIYDHWEKGIVELPGISRVDLMSLALEYHSQKTSAFGTFYDYQLEMREELFKFHLKNERNISSKDGEFVLLLCAMKQLISEIKAFWENKDTFLLPKFKTALTKAKNIINDTLNSFELFYISSVHRKRVVESISNKRFATNSIAKQRHDAIDIGTLEDQLPRKLLSDYWMLANSSVVLVERHGKRKEFGKLSTAMKYIQSYLNMVEFEILGVTE
jgi:hypothetical protein